jgi:hypothetical protein
MTDAYSTYTQIRNGDTICGTYLDTAGNEYQIRGVAYRDENATMGGVWIGNIALGTIPIAKTVNLEIVKKAWEPKFQVGDLVEFQNDNEYWNGRLARVVRVPESESGMYKLSCKGWDDGGWDEKYLKHNTFAVDEKIPYTDGQDWYTYDGATKKFTSLSTGGSWKPEKLDRLRAAR